MRFEGSLTAWNADRGYGAIVPEQGGQQVFVHISAFPRDGAPPVLGEALSFEIVTGGDGRKQAARIQRSQRAAPSPAAAFMAPAPQGRRERLRSAQRSRRLSTGAVALVLIVTVLGWWHLSDPGAERLAQRVSAWVVQR